MSDIAIRSRTAGGVVVAELRAWSPWRFAVAAVSAIAVAIAIGIPTDMLPNPFFRRMTPAVWWSYPIWLLTAALAGLVAASYVRAPGVPRQGQSGGRATAGGVLGFLAVGCPSCNSLVVALAGAGGAVSYFGPAQPLVGTAGLALLAAALVLRLRGLSTCRVDPRAR